MDLINCLLTKKNLLDVLNSIGLKNEKFPVILNDYKFIAGVTSDGIIELIVTSVLDNISNTSQQSKLDMINSVNSGTNDVVSTEMHVFHIKGNEVTIIQ